jgi:hypothetical protein
MTFDTGLEAQTRCRFRVCWRLETAMQLADSAWSGPLPWLSLRAPSWPVLLFLLPPLWVPGQPSSLLQLSWPALPSWWVPQLLGLEWLSWWVPLSWPPQLLGLALPSWRVPQLLGLAQPSWRVPQLLGLAQPSWRVPQLLGLAQPSWRVPQLLALAQPSWRVPQLLALEPLSSLPLPLGQGPLFLRQRLWGPVQRSLQRRFFSQGRPFSRPVFLQLPSLSP